MKSPIHEAISHRNHDKLKQLLDEGVDPNLIFKGETPMTEAVRLNDTISIDILLDYGAAKVIYNNQPLMKAYQQNVISDLLWGGIDPNKTDPITGDAPLHDAARRADIKKAEQLLKYGAYIDIQNAKTGMTPLHTCATSVVDSYVMTTFLLDRGAMPNSLDNDGKTPLHYAKMKNKDIVSLIIGRRGGV